MIMLIYSILTTNTPKNIVEKCGKVLTYSHFLYFCGTIGMKYAISKTSRTLIDAEFIYHIRL